MNAILGVSLSGPPPCQTRQCSNRCQHGYQVDNRGCNACICRQPPGKFNSLKSHCTGYRTRLVGKFINSAGISPTAKIDQIPFNKKTCVQYDDYSQKLILWFKNTV